MTDSVSSTTMASGVPSDQVFGHPRGLYTLFFTEMFERFTYYGMRALLILFMTAAVADGGLGMTAEISGAIYGLYTGAVYLLALPGGWVADRLLGQQESVWYGGILIAAGNFLLAIPSLAFFYIGLVVIVLGVGLLKPNISVIVGELYKHDTSARRDAGFSIFYMGINLGAFIAPLIAGTIGETVGYRWGFFTAGVAMAMGLLQYRMTGRYLGEAGKFPHPTTEGEQRRGWMIVAAGLAIVAVITALMLMGALSVDVVRVAGGVGVAMVAIAVFFFGSVLMFGGLTTDEKKKIGVIAIFFLCAALFWAGFEQAGTTFNLFARDYTDRSMLGGWFDSGEHPVSWYQSINPIFIILLSPFFAWLWVTLGRRNLDPSAPAKFGVGLILLGLGFGTMMLAAQLVVSTNDSVLPTWLLITYLLHTTGELCLSPIGLSNVTKLAPERFVGQMMGTWFLGAAVGNLVAGLIGGHVGGSDAADMPGQFFQMMMLGGGAGVLMLLFSRVIRKMMGGVQ